MKEKKLTNILVKTDRGNILFKDCNLGISTALVNNIARVMLKYKNIIPKVIRGKDEIEKIINLSNFCYQELDYQEFLIKNNIKNYYPSSIKWSNFTFYDL